MRDFAPFKLNRSGVLLALIFAGFAGTAGAVAGRVEFSIGAASVSGIDGRERPLAKGAELDTGDTVRTKDGRAQIRFTDGAYVSLQPNTDFSIKDYRFDGKTDGSERGLFGLARGAMRTITGLIGRVNRNAYQISTPTATVGIRGTGGQIEIEPDLATLVRSTSGIWYLANLAGSIDVPAGTSARAPADPNTPPQPTRKEPLTGPTQLPWQYTAGDDCARHPLRADCSKGKLTPPSTPPLQMVSGPGFHLSYAYGTLSGEGTHDDKSAGPDFANFNPSSQLTGYGTPPAPPARVFNFSGATHQEGNFREGVVGWGRYTGTVSYSGPPEPGFPPGTFTSNEGFHYVVGLPTATATMPTTGLVSFNFIGGTKPTFGGAVSPGSLSAPDMTMLVNFGLGTLTLSGKLNIGPGSGYNFSRTGMISGAQILPTGLATNVSHFGGSPPFFCDGNCTFSFNGAFFGSGAKYGGWVGRIFQTICCDAVTWAAVFQKPN